MEINPRAFCGHISFTRAGLLSQQVWVLDTCYAIIIISVNVNTELICPSQQHFKSTTNANPGIRIAKNEVFSNEQATQNTLKHLKKSILKKGRKKGSTRKPLKD